MKDAGKAATPDERACRRMTIAAVLLTVAVFLAASWAALSRLEEIRYDSRAIVTNGLPSIQSLSAARRKLGSIGATIAQLDRAPLTHDVFLELRQAIRGLEVDVNAYFALPLYPRERSEWLSIRACVDELHAAFDGIDPASPAGVSPERRTQLAAAIDRADAALLEAVELNAAEISQFVDEIDASRASAQRRALVFNGVGVVLAALLLLMALRSLRRQIAAERRMQQVLELRAIELEAFAGRVAHDLVAPLTPTVLWLERLRNSSDEATRHIAIRASRGVERVTELVDALFAFARSARDAHAGSPTDLVATAREVVSGFADLAENTSVELTLVSPGPVQVSIHPGIIASVLGNLVQNAIRYLGDAPVRRVTVRIQERGGRARVEVIDTGPGVPSALQERIFDPYFRAAGRDQPLGLGLGLATARRLVESHGGTIGVTSLGAGSTFWFELPITSSAARPAGASPR